MITFGLQKNMCLIPNIFVLGTIIRGLSEGDCVVKKMNLLQRI